MKPADLATLRLEQFRALLEQKFTVIDTPYVFTLLTVKAIPTRPNAPREAFSLLFRSPVPAQQGTYLLHHETLGNLEIFCVPVAQDSAGVQLEAVFS
ncbi:MAG: DUF6916 family protein [Deinococcales bacterium]